MPPCASMPNQSHGAGSAGGNAGSGAGAGSGGGGGSKGQPIQQKPRPAPTVVRQIPNNQSGLLNSFLAAFEGAKKGSQTAFSTNPLLTSSGGAIGNTASCPITKHNRNLHMQVGTTASPTTSNLIMIGGIGIILMFVLMRGGE